MTRLLELQEQLQETRAMLARVERAVAERPDKPSLGSLARSLLAQQRNLEADFASEADRLGMDVCSYRIFSDSGNLPLHPLAQGLIDFQSLVTVVYDAKKTSSKKERAKVSPEIRAESSFDFGYTFSGSLGVVLAISNERRLVLDSYLDETIRHIFALAEARNVSDIREFAKRLGLASIRAMYKWASGHAKAGLGVGIEWRREGTVRASLLAQQPELENLYRMIEETSDESETEISVDGELEAINVKARSFALRDSSGGIIRGSYKDAISGSHRAELPGRRYRATLTKVESVQYSTDEEMSEYHLKRLEELP